jgi:hypothetical protein
VTLLHWLDDLETGVEPYLRLDEAQRVVGQDLSDLIREGVLLVDYRQHLRPDGTLEAIRLCRLNRHHPRVKALRDPDWH